VVRKVYRGPDAPTRLSREAAALTALAERLPVAPVLDRDETSLIMGFLPGVPRLAGPAAGDDQPLRGHAGPVPALGARRGGGGTLAGPAADHRGVDGMSGPGSYRGQAGLRHMRE
jgi:hypothetical protein